MLFGLHIWRRDKQGVDNIVFKLYKQWIATRSLVQLELNNSSIGSESNICMVILQK